MRFCVISSESSCGSKLGEIFFLNISKFFIDFLKIKKEIESGFCLLASSLVQPYKKIKLKMHPILQVDLQVDLQVEGKNFNQ